jgi:predicted nucleic acid-binding protein
MALTSPRFIADKSALARLAQPTVDRRLTPLLLSGEIATCSIIDLEILYSARNHVEFAQVLGERKSLHAVPIEQLDFERAIAVMELLARKGKHRGPGIPDLLIAAVAEREGLRVLHYDADFDLIATVTGQEMEWIVPAGSVP